MLDLVNNIMSNFVSVIMCKIIFRKSKMDDIEAFEKLFYAFDFPSLTENGWIDISDNSIVLTFPEKPTVYVKDAYDIIQNSQLFVNNQLVFAIDWLPIYTLLDFLRVKDMLEKCLQSYTNLIGEKVFVPHTYLWAPNKIFNSAVTNFSKGDDFILYCYEDPNTSQIQLTLPESTDFLDRNIVSGGIGKDGSVRLEVVEAVSTTDSQVNRLDLVKIVLAFCVI